jgi:hypothetical protein
MTRPSSHNDLSNYDRKGLTIANIYGGDAMLEHPTIGQHLTAALVEAQRLGLSIKGGDIMTVLTAEELDAKLATAQADWDRGEEAYLKYLEDGTFPSHNFKWSDYLTAERIATPKKDEAAK